MEPKELLENEIIEIAKRLQTHADAEEKEYGIDWGSIQIYFHQDETISVIQEEIGRFRFNTPRAVAEFIVFNIVPILHFKNNPVEPVDDVEEGQKQKQEQEQESIVLTEKGSVEVEMEDGKRVKLEWREI